MNAAAPMDTSIDRVTPLAFAVTVCVWSTTPLAMAWSSIAVHPVTAALLRMVIATVLGLLLVAAFRVRLPVHSGALRSYVYGAIGVFGAMFCGYMSTRYIGTGLISVVFGLSPIAVNLFARFLLRESGLSGRQWIAVLLAIAGLAVIFNNELAIAGDTLYGFLLSGAGMTLFSLSAVMVKRANVPMHPLSQAVGAMAVAIPPYVISWFVLDRTVPILGPDDRSLWAILYLATVGSLLGMLAYFHILRRLPAKVTALVTLMTPVLALLLGHFLNHEALGAAVVAGTAMILCGLLLFMFTARTPARRLR